MHARELAGWSLAGFLAMDEPAFRAVFATSPIRRADREGFLRNVCIALGNRAELEAIPALTRSLERDPSALVRGSAAWALGRIAVAAPAEAAARAIAALQRAAGDDDASVREEAALAFAEVAARDA
jgi:epoxyqueuosine reductase